MKPRAPGSLLTITAFLTFLFSPLIAANAQSQTPFKNSPFRLTTYSTLRTGFESPVEISSLRGGKAGPNEQLAVEVMQLRNEAAKNIRAIKFQTFIFDSNDLNVALERVQTSIFTLDIPALEGRKCQFLILNIDDIPLLAYKPGQEFRLEVAVAEVHYEDGSIWQASTLPGKLVLPKAR